MLIDETQGKAVLRTTHAIAFLQAFSALLIFLSFLLLIQWKHNDAAKADYFFDELQQIKCNITALKRAAGLPLSHAEDAVCEGQ